MALSYITAKWLELTWWISGRQHTNLIEERSFDFISVCFFICSMLLLSILLYKKLENKDLTVKEFKICIALKLISFFVSRKLSCPDHRPSKRTKFQRPGPIPPSHLPIFLKATRRCTVCSQAGKESRTFVTCSLCDVALCLQKERNCFLQYHS